MVLRGQMDILQIGECTVCMYIHQIVLVAIGDQREAGSKLSRVNLASS